MGKLYVPFKLNDHRYQISTTSTRFLEKEKNYSVFPLPIIIFALRFLPKARKKERKKEEWRSKYHSSHSFSFSDLAKDWPRTLLRVPCTLINILLFFPIKEALERVDFFFPLLWRKRGRSGCETTTSPSGNNRARTKSPSVYTAGHARSKRVTAVEILFGLWSQKEKKKNLFAR